MVIANVRLTIAWAAGKLVIFRRLALTILISFPIFCAAKDTYRDSLLTVLNQIPKSANSLAEDTIRIALLCELGRGKDRNGLFVGDFKQSIKWLDEANRLSQKHNWTKGLLLSNLFTGVWYFWKGSSLAALQKILKARYYAELLKDPIWLGRTYRHLGDLYNILGNYDQSIVFLTKALEPSMASDPIVHLVVLQNLGTSYFGKKNYSKAFFWMDKAYRATNRAKSQQMPKYVILNWAEVCIAVGDTAKLNSLMDEYEDLQFTDRAWDVHYYSLNAQRYLLEKNAPKALEELKKGLSYINVASDEHRQEIFLQFSRAYEQLGNASQSLTFYKQYAALWEKDIKAFQKRQTEYLKYEYENAQQQDAIKLLNKDISEQKQARTRLWFGIVLAFLFVILLILNNRILSRKNHLIENLKNRLSDSNNQLVRFNDELEVKVAERTEELLMANDELVKKNSEIIEAFASGKSQERIRVASELHDNLGSTISGLLWQLQNIMPENLVPKEQEIYEGLILQMRNAYSEIRHISHHLVPSELEKGLDTALQRLLNDLNNNPKIAFRMEGDYPRNFIAKEKEAELYSICLELINNTLKHSESTQCLLAFKKTDSTLELLLTDNGKGFNPNEMTKRGKGLVNIQERVKTLQGTFFIESQIGKGASFKVTI